MPYIKQEDRDVYEASYTFTSNLDEIIYMDGEVKIDLNKILSSGHLNFIITKLCDDYLTMGGISYNNLNEIIGILECVKLEFYRRRVSIYEDKKIEENGDVFDGEI